MEKLSASLPAVSLQSKDHEELLNTIDLLRSQGISRYVDLPQLIVCGDQSSGKSSVLEAVSGIQFPTKDNLCTRFATELILRRGLKKTMTVTIVPGRERLEEEKRRLLHFNDSDKADLNDFAGLIESAKIAMGLDGDAKAFSSDILRVEIMGPTQPHLTLVDLPGLFQASNKAQSEHDVNVVKSLVLGYMQKTRSIILAVVSAKNDFANQIVTKYARDLDPMGLRTLGLITKPDTLHPGSESEAAFFELAQNKDVTFRLGWHVLKNRDYSNRNCSQEERDQAEEDFFSRGIWSSLSPSNAGIKSLKPRLSTVLKDQILSELPGLIRDVEAGISDCKGILAKLGAPRGTTQEQRLHLLQISQQFSSLMKASTDGVYVDAFFGSAQSEEGYQKRLRAVVQNTLIEFANMMRNKGHRIEIVDELTSGDESDDDDVILRSEYIDKVHRLMRRSRGCELPGTFNPLIIGDLFYEHSQPWKGLVDMFATMIFQSSRTAVDLILESTADSVTSSGLLSHIINPAMESIKQGLFQRVSDLLEPHQRGHPITYNHYLIENMQKARERHLKQSLKQKLTSFFIKNISEDDLVMRANFSISSLLDSLSQTNEEDMDRYSCSEAIDCMLAYYKVAMKVLVDDFSVLGIEKCLLQKLPSLFNPETVIRLNEEKVKSIAAETASSVVERNRTTEKLKTLEQSLDVLTRLDRHKPEHVSVSSRRPVLERLSSGCSSMQNGSRSETPLGVRSLKLDK